MQLEAIRRDVADLDAWHQPLHGHLRFGPIMPRANFPEHVIARFLSPQGLWTSEFGIVGNTISPEGRLYNMVYLVD